METSNSFIRSPSPLLVFAGGAWILFVLASCGDPNVCQQACERQQSCGRAALAKIDCNNPSFKAACDAVRQALAIDCSMASDAACQGTFRAMSERTVRCTMDPQTCACPYNPCIEACDDQKDCAEDSLDSMNCTDPRNQTTCSSLNQMMQKDCYSIPDETCTGTAKTAAEEIHRCFIDRTTCICPAGP